MNNLIFKKFKLKLNEEKNDFYYMKIAYNKACDGFLFNEVPIGAVAVYKNKIISSAFNLNNYKKNPIAHAEMIVLSRASHKIGDWRLNNVTIYVTKEPCIMCTGAIIMSRVKKLVFGCKDPKIYKSSKLYKLVSKIYGINNNINILNGILEKECSLLIKNFFYYKRKKY